MSRRWVVLERSDDDGPSGGSCHAAAAVRGNGRSGKTSSSGSRTCHPRERQNHPPGGPSYHQRWEYDEEDEGEEDNATKPARLSPWRYPTLAMDREPSGSRGPPPAARRSDARMQGGDAAAPPRQVPGAEARRSMKVAARQEVTCRFRQPAEEGGRPRPKCGGERSRHEEIMGRGEGRWNHQPASSHVLDRVRRCYMDEDEEEKAASSPNAHPPVSMQCSPSQPQWPDVERDSSDVHRPARPLQPMTDRSSATHSKVDAGELLSQRLLHGLRGLALGRRIADPTSPADSRPSVDRRSTNHHPRPFSPSSSSCSSSSSKGWVAHQQGGWQDWTGPSVDYAVADALPVVGQWPTGAGESGTERAAPSAVPAEHSAQDATHRGDYDDEHPESDEGDMSGVKFTDCVAETASEPSAGLWTEAPGPNFAAFNNAQATAGAEKGQPAPRSSRKAKAVPLAEFLGQDAGMKEDCPPGANYALWRGLKETAPQVPSFGSRRPPLTRAPDRLLCISPDSYRRQPCPAEDRPKLDLAATGRLIRFTVGRPKRAAAVTFKGRGSHFGARVLDDATVDYGLRSAQTASWRSDVTARRPSI